MSISRNCHECGSRFQTTPHNRIFCSYRCGARYRRRNPEECFFCGEAADTIEHLYPQSYGFGSGDKVMACRECNSRLCSHHAHSTELRIRHLIKSHTRAYRLDKKIPEWADEEFAELDGNLHKSVRGQIIRREIAIDRLEHMKSRLREVIRLSNYKHESEDA